MNIKILIILGFIVFTNGRKMCLMNEFRLFLCMKRTTTSSPVLFHDPERDQQIKSRIVGGSAISISQVPYQLSIELYNKHICGATIISANWALSAAHCFPDMYPIHAMKVRSGTNRATYFGKVHGIEEVILHKNYHAKMDGTPVNDIALIHVKEPFLYSNLVNPIEMFRKDETVPVGTEAIISGWGLLSEIKENAKLDLHTATVPIMSQEECHRSYSKIPPGQMCAGYQKGGIDSCAGDSGGPMAINKKLAGVVSWGIGCARPGYPGVYTEVAFYRKWIQEKTGV